MKRTIIMLTTLSLGLLTIACHTMSGVGEDVSAGGKGIEKTADKHTSY